MRHEAYPSNDYFHRLADKKRREIARSATLFDSLELVEQEELPPDASPAERAEAFHRANPNVYKMLVSECRRFVSAGNTKWSINGAFERLRWVASKGGFYDDYKLNNSYRAFYARTIMEREPDLSDIFKTRKTN